MLSLVCEKFSYPNDSVDTRKLYWSDQNGNDHVASFTFKLGMPSDHYERALIIVLDSVGLSNGDSSIDIDVPSVSPVRGRIASILKSEKGILSALPRLNSTPL